ncbi:hypothetical protein ABZP36_022514 [Zizania latifolia]
MLCSASRQQQQLLRISSSLSSQEQQRRRARGDFSLSAASTPKPSAPKAPKANCAMGNTPPVRPKFTDEKENDRIKYVTSTCQGRNEKMEDAFAAILDLDDTNSTSFFGVYDGHGGADVALYYTKQFHIELCNQEDYHNNLTNAVERVFFSLDEKLQQSDDWRVTPRDNQWLHCLKAVVCAKLWTFPQATDTGPDYLGYTACVVVVRGNKIIVGNVGDSRCILSRNGQAIDLVHDHQPEIQSEIRTVGGGSEEQISICNPDILTVDITEDVEFLVIASRGLRRSDMSSEEVVDFEKAQGLRAICEDLTEKGLPSGENTTVILVVFKAGDPVASASASAAAEADNNTGDEVDAATFVSADDMTSDVFTSASDRAEADNNTGDEVDPTASASASDSDRAEDDNKTGYEVDSTASASDRAEADNNTGDEVDATFVSADDTTSDVLMTNCEIEEA